MNGPPQGTRRNTPTGVPLPPDPRRTQRPAKSLVQATRHVYDVMILGGQIGGALAGALLAKHGYRVLHVDVEGLGTAYEHDGYQLPYAPGLVPSPRLMPQADSSLIELGIAVDIQRALDAGGDEIQLLFAKNRLDFPKDGGRRATEIGREFPADKEQVLSALDATAQVLDATNPFFRTALPFPADGFLEKYAVRKASLQSPVSRACRTLDEVAGQPVAAAVRALGKFLTYLDDEQPYTGAQARPVAQLLHGAYRYPGGRPGLREALRKRLVELGGDVLGGEGEPAAIEELIFEGTHLSGVKLAATKNVFRSQCVISAMDLGALSQLFPPKTKKRALSELFESVRTRHSPFTHNLVVNAAALPLGLKELALLMPADEELGPVLLEVLPARQTGRESPGERVLCAGVFISNAEHDLGAAKLRERAAQVEAAILDIAPFLDEHIVARSIPSLDAGSRATPHPLFELGDDRALGVAGVTTRTPWKNLFLASREVLPGLGLEGEFMAGNRAAALVQEMLRKHDPLK